MQVAEVGGKAELSFRRVSTRPTYIYNVQEICPQAAARHR